MTDRSPLDGRTDSGSAQGAASASFPWPRARIIRTSETLRPSSTATSASVLGCSPPPHTSCRRIIAMLSSPVSRAPPPVGPPAPAARDATFSPRSFLSPQKLALSAQPRPGFLARRELDPYWPTDREDAILPSAGQRLISSRLTGEDENQKRRIVVFDSCEACSPIGPSGRRAKAL
jgi:hypothetical protein